MVHNKTGKCAQLQAKMEMSNVLIIRPQVHILSTQRDQGEDYRRTEPLTPPRHQRQRLHSTPCIKLQSFFKKLPNFNDDHFQKHYNYVHADLTVASECFNAFEIQRYVQVHKGPTDSILKYQS